MARDLPTVRESVLIFPDSMERGTVVVGSAAWWAWAAAPGTTSFRFAAGPHRFTARREQKPGGSYWYAYRQQQGVLRKVYLGRSVDLTLERLMWAATTLTQAPTPTHPNHDAAPAPRTEPVSRSPGLLMQTHVLPLLATKLAAPLPPPQLVFRPRLLEQLQHGLPGKLTLLSAPAGFGKTTLLSAWLPNSQRAVAWLSLDVEDNDPTQFLRYLVAALRTIEPSFGQALFGMLHSLEVLSLSSLLTVLINDLAVLPHPCMLVLDDYHVLRAPPIHQTVSFLLEHLPPQLHLVIATREDPPLPLARLRVRRHLHELRAADLRFTADEAAAFLNGVIGLTLSTADVEALQEKTEGWIAGLQLAALSMHDRDDIAGFIAAFTGSNRFVVDYLAEEVLSSQPDVVHAFLLHTSILDRLCASLCDAVTGAHGSQAMLEQLDHANLFLVPLDHAQHWYRYHHLFADLLQHRLRLAQPTLVLELHGRASAWYAQAGLASEAIQHAVLAQDFQRAADLLEHRAEALWTRGELVSLQRWFDALPGEVTRSRPRLLLAHAWQLVLSNPANMPPIKAILHDVELLVRAREADAHLNGVQSPADSHELAEMRSILAVIRSAVGSNQGDIPGTIALAREALEHLPGQAVFWRIIPLVNLGMAYAAQGDVAAASHTLVDAISLSQEAGNHYTALVATRTLADVRALQGYLHAAADLYRGGLRMAAEHGWHAVPFTGYLHVGLGKLLYEWNDLETATRHLMEALTTVGLRERPWAVAEAYMLLACVKQAQGDIAGVHEMIRHAEQTIEGQKHLWGADVLPAYRARVWLAQGHTARAATWAEQAELRFAPPITDIYHEFVLITLARVRMAQGKPAQALALLNHLVHAAEAAGRTTSTIELLALRALALHACGETSQALIMLQRSLMLAEPEGHIRTFTDAGTPLAALLERVATTDVELSSYAHTLVAACGDPRHDTRRMTDGVPSSSLRGPLPLVEPLNERERDVLRLIAQGLSNRDIADRQVIALSTVKWYLNTIYAKLGVHSRTQAVARAQEIGLL